MGFGAYTQAKDGSYIPAIPMPFWERSWRTFFRERPMCCDKIFHNEDEYTGHYYNHHIIGREKI